MHSDVAVLKLKSNGMELAKKKGSFLDLLFFLSILEAGSSAVEALGQDDLSVAYLYLNIY